MTFVVTPWEVRGEINYDKLVKDFGIQKITDSLYKRIADKGDLHILLRRKVFFSHRDLDWILNEYDKGNKFYLYTGRGPAGNVHLGHIMSWTLTKWLQDKFDAKLYFQMTDDEKFLFKENLSLEEANRLAYENALDVIALGFDPKKTFIFSDIDYAKTLYREALKVSKKLTFSTTKAVFGFKNETNIGQIFFTSMQAVPAFLESVKRGKNVPCLIPYGIDQDPHFRIARDVLPKLGYYKPAAIISKFIPGLGPGGKMSTSEPETCIFTTDSQKDVERKIKTAFTGGAKTLEEQKKRGGKPEVCSVYQNLYVLFEPDDKEIKDLFFRCKKGRAFCGECKQMLTKYVTKFLKEHQKKRKKARKQINKFLLKN